MQSLQCLLVFLCFSVHLSTTIATKQSLLEDNLTKSNIDQSKVHVAMSCDRAQLNGLVASASSIIHFASDSSKLILHVLGNAHMRGYLNEVVSCLDTRDASIVVDIVDLSHFSLLHNTSDIYFAERVRIYLPDILNDAEKIIWVDCDTIFKSDVIALVRSLFKDDKNTRDTVGGNTKKTSSSSSVDDIIKVHSTIPLIAAAQHKVRVINQTHYKFLAKDIIKSCYIPQESLKSISEINNDLPYWDKDIDWSSAVMFNAGFYVINSVNWRIFHISKYIERIVDILQKSKFQGLYGNSIHSNGSDISDTQTPVVILMHLTQGWIPLHWSWNVEGLGWKYEICDHPIFHNANVLHWTGKDKGWFEISGKCRGLWKQLECTTAALQNCRQVLIKHSPRI